MGYFVNKVKYRVPREITKEASHLGTGGPEMVYSVKKIDRQVAVG